MKGIFAIYIEDELVYIKTCDNLAHILNYSYGHISPADCYHPSKAQFCKVNSAIYIAASRSKLVELYFYPGTNTEEIYRSIVHECKPKLNTSPRIRRIDYSKRNRVPLTPMALKTVKEYYRDTVKLAEKPPEELWEKFYREVAKEFFIKKPREIELFQDSTLINLCSLLSIFNPQEILSVLTPESLQFSEENRAELLSCLKKDLLLEALFFCERIEFNYKRYSFNQAYEDFYRTFLTESFMERCPKYQKIYAKLNKTEANKKRILRNISELGTKSDLFKHFLCCIVSAATKEKKNTSLKQTERCSIKAFWHLMPCFAQGVCRS